MSKNLIGWTGYQWVTPVPCVACKSPITAGIVNVSVLRSPIMPKITRALCWSCWYQIPATSDDWTGDAARLVVKSNDESQ